ncbi:Protoheme IX farnesyltransferase, mitochondrial [Halocaridina rubra]|uniref:Protoheme IX farnesyltransferase, mitochondrial n=1 Tax=Halocaridina rubra TaxID=373956 RepID=A0AAN8W967_HALRR
MALHSYTPQNKSRVADHCSVIWIWYLAMYNLVNSLGLNVAVRASEIGHVGKIVSCRSVISRFVSEHGVLLCRHRKCSSKAIFTNNECSDPSQDLSSVIKQVELTTNNGAGIMQCSKVKVLLIEKSLALKALVSNEGPAVHHARLGSVVHVKADKATSKDEKTKNSQEVEVQLQVDELLKRTKSSIENASDPKPYEDIEFIEESRDKKREKTELVGALRPNALDWKPQHVNIWKLGSQYSSLAKDRLTGLVVLTAMAGYAMAPGPFDPVTFVCCSVGTGFTSSAANTINQFFEVPYDSQMDRTRNRILVRGLLTPFHAMCFATVCSILGVGILNYGANGYAAGLGALNLFLYTSVYTPLKRISIVNTWVGSVVGAIPPLIGWVGSSGGLETGAWIMAGILYTWQFPHFNSLSWNLRPDYSRAGYRMMSVTNPRMCKAVALRHSIGMITICTLAPVLGVTTWTFAVDSLPFNGYLTYLAWRFYKDGDSKSSRKLFMFSLIHLPAILMLLIISKNHGKRKDDDVAPKDMMPNKVNLVSLSQDSLENVR